jgi:folylpolyglutamate synthase/dihydropteroate synthase
LEFARSKMGYDGLLICGSLYLAGELRGLLKGPNDLEKI